MPVSHDVPDSPFAFPAWRAAADPVGCPTSAGHAGARAKRWRQAALMRHRRKAQSARQVHGAFRCLWMPKSRRRSSGGPSASVDAASWGRILVEDLVGSTITRLESANHASDLGFRAPRPKWAFQNRATSVPTLVQGNALTSGFVNPHIRYEGGGLRALLRVIRDRADLMGLARYHSARFVRSAGRSAPHHRT